MYDQMVFVVRAVIAIPFIFALIITWIKSVDKRKNN